MPSGQQGPIRIHFPSTTTTTLPYTYIAAFCDRTRAPETESWIFTSFEVAAAPPEDEAACINLVLTLSRTIHDLPHTLPPDIPSLGSSSTFTAWGSEETFSAVPQVPDAPRHNHYLLPHISYSSSGAS
ncbi:hypothetical protein PILCRDRAFT_13086 [Piloderma croceum F 1598]|uniref:Uncharacterized protein n=1 Tax=Piloderma croceum (strain F 1598) TaxID=765440 RepID=A0A0C3F829_PILCF|nr:hypothetical protein PILCRDRAFT_13086 [Piloderma croceum F 1598]